MGANDPARFERLKRLFEEKIPFNRVLGIELERVESGRARFRVPFREELIGDPTRRALHGGVLSAVADACGGCAVWSVIGEADRVSTIDLRVDYLRPGRPEVLIAEAEVQRVGNRVGVARVVLSHLDDPSVTVAEAKGVYSIRRASSGGET